MRKFRSSVHLGALKCYRITYAYSVTAATGGAPTSVSNMNLENETPGREHRGCKSQHADVHAESGVKVPSNDLTVIR